MIEWLAMATRFGQQEESLNSSLVHLCCEWRRVLLLLYLVQFPWALITQT